MTVADVILRSRDLADLQGTQFIKQREELASLNEAYRDSYELITQKNDDFFSTQLVYPWSSAIPSSTSAYEWYFNFPTNFYKLRTVDYLQSGKWQTMRKFTLRQRNASNSDPSYRMQNKQLWIVGPSAGSYLGSDIRINYYPVPYTFTTDDITGIVVPPANTATSTEIPYPTALAPEILSYSMAIDYKRKQSIDASGLDARRAELWTRYEQSLLRDDYQYEAWQNVYTASAPWR